MMKTKYLLFKKNTLITCAALLTLFGCTGKFSDWNTNPYQATDEMMDHDNLRTGAFFVQMQKGIMICGKDKTGDYQITQNLAGDVYSGYMGACGLWYSNSNNCTYALVDSWYKASFNEAYTDIMQPWSSIKTAAETKTPGVVAMATILKVEGMSRITDMYGPIPYSKFGSGALQVSYDSQKNVYYKFFDELDSAIVTLTDLYKGDNSVKLLSKYDFVYSGKVVNWIKFANTLKLRLAMRLAYVDPTKAQAEAESAVSQSVGVMTGADDSAVLTQSSDLTFLNPLWEICYSFGDVRMGATMDSYLNGYNDPRLSKYFVKASDNKYRGIRNGINISNKATYSEGPFSELNFVSGAGMYWMNASEAYFLRAEGAVRGWNMNGAAKDLYESGVKVSFTSWGASGVDTYLADNVSVPATYTDTQNGGNSSNALSSITIKWDEDASTAEKMERIITQKWIASYPDGQEAWSEYRRTGYPKIFPNKVNKSGGTIDTDIQIRRLPFPSTEYSNNATEVAKGVTLLGGADNGGTRLWWDVASK
jgi:hypothetical protein